MRCDGGIEEMEGMDYMDDCVSGGAEEVWILFDIRQGYVRHALVKTSAELFWCLHVEKGYTIIWKY